MSNKKVLLMVVSIAILACGSTCYSAAQAYYNADANHPEADNPGNGSGIGDWTVAAAGTIAAGADAVIVGGEYEHAWKIESIGQTSPAYAYYHRGGSLGVWNLASTDWIATARLKVGYATSGVGGVILLVDDGQDIWSIGYQLTSATNNGWTYIQADGTYVAQLPEDVDSMQTWQMIYHADTETLEYYLDGVKIGPTLTRADVQDSAQSIYEYLRWGRTNTTNAINTRVWFNSVSLYVDGLVCGEPYPYPSDADIDGNCKVDLSDFAIMAADWLDCTLNCD